jgi:hypothetical protein
MRDAATTHEHPSPHRTRVSAAALLFALAIGPATWALQQTLSYGLTSHVCFPSDAPVAPTPSAWSALWPAILASTIAFLLLAFSGLWIALGAWRATREEKGGSHSALLEMGEGRSRFLALCGLLAGSLFCLAIVFDLAVALSLRSCGTPAS